MTPCLDTLKKETFPLKTRPFLSFHAEKLYIGEYTSGNLRSLKIGIKFEFIITLKLLNRAGEPKVIYDLEANQTFILYCYNFSDYV